MTFLWRTKRGVVLWQLLFILLSVTWLLAPHLNHLLSYRTSLISQYEAPGQPFSWLFRLCDILGAALLMWAARSTRHDHPTRKIAAYLLLVIGAGMLFDALWPVGCHRQALVCKEYFSFSFAVHAAETVVTATAIIALSVYDSWLRKRLVSICFVVFQVLYGLLFISQLADQENFNTFSQYVYQLIVILWIAWFYRDFFVIGESAQPVFSRGRLIKYTAAAWAFINGLLAIILSLKHLHLLGRFKGLYFAGNNAWLAQHGVVAGVILLYISRHLARGERRARQIFLLIAGLEVLEYSVLSPSLPLLLTYLFTFCALFVLRDEFDRGVEVVTLEMRIREALYMVAALLMAMLIGLSVLFRTNRLSRITSQSLDHFFDYTLRSHILPRTQVRSALLAHTISVFLVTGIATILWILFRPYKKQARGGRDRQEVTGLLGQYSGSSEDYFKLWPADKEYFWPADKSGFIAYKETGPIAFALADPICAMAKQPELIDEFINWARGRRLRACFLPIYSDLRPYEEAGLNSLQIGANARLEIATFLDETVQDKWWRWQKNRASKSGYQYASAKPPHSAVFIAELKTVSDAWLDKDRQERSFAQGYFDPNYLQQCPIDYLRDSGGKIVAFTNRLPLFKPAGVASVDLLRYFPEANNAMPYLLYKTIENISEQGGYKYFDLGFAPFAAAKSPVIRIARALTSNRISAKGLERFKNKFKPEWQAVYLAYDGDLGDLALVTANVEKAMRVSD